MMLVCYLGLWAFIAFVAAYDTYINICYPVTIFTELNPIARLILDFNNGFALLISLKLLGTSIVMSLLAIGYFYSKKHAYCVIIALALVQLAVLMFLCLG